MGGGIGVAVEVIGDVACLGGVGEMFHIVHWGLLSKEGVRCADRR